MRKGILYIAATVAVFTLSAGVTWSSSSPGGKTNSPGDGENCTKCHNGSSINKSGWISSNIPANGYISGQTYTIVVTGNHTGSSVFGFECTAEDLNNQKVGMFIISDAIGTRFPPNINTAITHTDAGTSASGNSKSWSFDWTAPMTGTGTVTFYAGINAADGNMGTGGDQIYNSSLAVNEATTSILNAQRTEIAVPYPNPATHSVYMQNTNQEISEISIYDISGKLQLKRTISDIELIKMNVEGLEKGNYFIHVKGNNAKKVYPFIKL